MIGQNRILCAWLPHFPPKRRVLHTLNDIHLPHCTCRHGQNAQVPRPGCLVTRRAPGMLFRTGSFWQDQHCPFDRHLWNPPHEHSQDPGCQRSGAGLCLGRLQPSAQHRRHDACHQREGNGRGPADDPDLQPGGGGDLCRVVHPGARQEGRHPDRRAVLGRGCPQAGGADQGQRQEARGHLYQPFRSGLLLRAGYAEGRVPRSADRGHAADRRRHRAEQGHQAEGLGATAGRERAQGHHHSGAAGR